MNDLHLNSDVNVTRYRNYVSSKFAELAIENNSDGSFLSAGISYGTSLKIITHLLDPKVKNINYFLIDNYQNIGDGNYNTDINNVKKDLHDIKNFNFKFILDLLNKSSLNRIDNNLIFSHINIGKFESEYEFLPEIINKTKNKGIILIDNYGAYSQPEIKKLDDFISGKSNLYKIIFPSLQCVIIKF